MINALQIRTVEDQYYGAFFRRPPSTALGIAAAPILAQLAPTASGSTIGKLLLFFLKSGSLTFGSGLVIVPFLQQGLVQQYGWLDQRQFLIAVGMISPGVNFGFNMRLTPLANSTA